MKKILISLILILSLILSGCNFLESDGEGEACTEGNHTDKDDNGLCDECRTSVIVELNFFVLNDFHGKMADSDSQPGVDELSTYLKSRTKNNPNSILLSSGDMWQGGAESNLTKGIIVTEWMNELDFVSMTLGNHEFDWGEEFIIANGEAAEFPFLAINVYDSETKERVEYCQSSVMIERGGIEIGIIGAIGDCYSSISSDKTNGIYFKVGDELTELVKAESAKLKAEGADIIVYSLHDGLSGSSGNVISDSKLESYYDPALSSGDYVDVVFEGHTHKKYNSVDNYGVYHIQAGGDNSAISQTEIKVNSANGKTTVTDSDIISNGVYDNADSDPYVDELFKKYEDALSKAYEVLGTNSAYRSSKYLNQLIAKLYFEFAVAEYGDEFDIALGGGYLKTRSPYEIEAGSVTYSDLMMIYPFDNPLVLCSIKGYYLKTKFFETDNSDYFIYCGEYGESLKNNIDNNATYYVLVDTYTAQYAPNRLTVVKEYSSDFFARDLLAEYIRNGGLQ